MSFKLLKFPIILISLLLTGELISQIADDFEFLDHRTRSSFLGASTVIEDKIYYVSHNGLNPWTTFNVADKNNQVQTLLELKWEFSNSRLFEINDTSAVIIIDNLIEYDLGSPGFYLINLSPNNVTIDSLFNVWSDNAIFVESVSLDSLGRQVLSANNSLWTVDRGEIVDWLNLDANYQIFHNNKHELFGYANGQVFRYDNGAFVSIVQLDVESLQFLDSRSAGDKNYLLFRDYSTEDFHLRAYNEDLSEEIYSINLPYDVSSLDQFAFKENETQVIFTHDNLLEIMLLDDEGNLSTLYTDESINEVYSKFIPLGEERILLMGAYGPDFNQFGFSNFSRNIFFRNHSLIEENIYERANVSIKNIDINRLTSDTINTHTRAPGEVLHFGNHFYDIDLEVQNDGAADVSLVNVYSEAKLDGVSDKFHLDFEFDKRIEAGSSNSLNYKLSAYHESKGLRDSTDLPLFIPGADFKFNQNPFSDLQITVDVEDLILDSAFTLYPNPTSDLLNIDLDNKIRTATIYNLNGQLIYHKEGNIDSNNIDVSTLSGGTYFIKLEMESKKGYILSKFVKI